MQPIELGTGQALWVHDPEKCAGRHCSIHNPSDHPLKNAPLNWRSDRAIMERICEHGIGHDDPDDLEYRRKHRPGDSSGIHGCDGCCTEPIIATDKE